MKPQKNYKGYIYRINKSGTDDKIISLIARDGSRVSCISKGARKPNSKKSHSLGLGNLVEIKVVEGYAISILSDIKVLKSFKIEKENIMDIFFLQLVCEIINFFIYEEPEEDLFTLTEFVMKNFDKVEKYFLLSIYTLKVLIISGNLPKLNESILNGENISSENAYFSENTVGYISENNDEFKITPRVYKAQRFIEKFDTQDCLKLSLTTDESKNLLRIHLNWIEILFQKNIKSRKLIRI